MSEFELGLQRRRAELSQRQLGPPTPHQCLLLVSELGLQRPINAYIRVQLAMYTTRLDCQLR